MAFGKFFEIEVAYGHSDMLFLTTGIGKTQVHKFDLVVLNHLHDVSCSHFSSLLSVVHESFRGVQDAVGLSHRGHLMVI